MKFGDQLNLGITYSPATGHLDIWAQNPQWGSYGDDFWTEWSYTLPAQSFSKARIGTDFGSSPWDASYSYTPPAGPVKLAAYTGVSLTSYSGHKADLSSWWMRHELLARPSGRGLVAIPHDLTGGGANFGTWFVPKSAQISS